jgi:hypothetical protein
MVHNDHEIQEYVLKICKQLDRELNGRMVKIPDKTLKKAINISYFLKGWVDTYIDGTINPGEKCFFLISVGILIGIFYDVPNSEEISETLKKLQFALTGLKLNL